MRLEPVDATSEAHVEALYEVALEQGDLGEPTEAFAELMRSVLPDTDDDAIDALTRDTEERYAKG